jgi:hypothetical protein
MVTAYARGVTDCGQGCKHTSNIHNAEKILYTYQKRDINL